MRHRPSVSEGKKSCPLGRRHAESQTVAPLMSTHQNTIQGLSGRQLRAVISGLEEITREALSEVYASDQQSFKALNELDANKANAVLVSLVPDVHPQSAEVTDEELRNLLLALDDDPDLQPYMRKALERRLLVSSFFDPAVMGPLLVFLFSIKWKFKVKKAKGGKVEFEFEAGKNATPAGMLRSLLAKIPGFGSDRGSTTV